MVTVTSSGDSKDEQQMWVVGVCDGWLFLVSLDVDGGCGWKVWKVGVVFDMGL